MIEILEGLAESLTWLLIVGVITVSAFIVFFSFKIFKDLYGFAFRLRQDILCEVHTYKENVLIANLLYSNDCPYEVMSIIYKRQSEKVSHIEDMVYAFNENCPFFMKPFDIFLR